MRGLSGKIVAALGLASILVSVPASAAIIVESYDFTATTDGPITSHSGSFSFSYDDANPTVLTLQSINFSLGSYVFDLSNTGIFTGGAYGFILGGTVNGIGGLVAPGFNDFRLYTNSTNGDLFAYTVPDYSGIPGGTPTITPIDAAVPELATWAMMLFGFFGIGGLVRSQRRKQKVAVSYA